MIENRMVLDGEWEPIPIKEKFRRDPEDEERFPFDEEPIEETGEDEPVDWIGNSVWDALTGGMKHE